MIQWFIDNKEWVFSGVGVAVATFLLTLILNRKKSSKDKHASNIQIGGDGSNNYQSHGDMIIGSNNDKKKK